ncbi:hypothetical protein ABT320_01650 [Streptomyces cellulosae]
MKFWPRRRPPATPEPERANPTRIAVLEHDLLGIPPKPGSAAALAIAMRRTGTCIDHDPVEMTGFGEARPNGLCTRCGAAMVLDDEGAWQVARVP